MIGEMGLPMFVSARHINWTELAVYVRRYQEAYAAAGHPGKGEVFLSVPTYVAETEAQARADAAPSIMQFYRQQAELQADSLGALGRPGAGSGIAARAAAQHVLRAGAARTCSGRHARDDRRSPARLARGADLGGILAELNCGGIIPHRQVMSALRLLCEEVAPQFR